MVGSSPGGRQRVDLVPTNLAHHPLIIDYLLRSPGLEGSNAVRSGPDKTNQVGGRTVHENRTEQGDSTRQDASRKGLLLRWGESRNAAP